MPTVPDRAAALHLLGCGGIFHRLKRSSNHVLSYFQDLASDNTSGATELIHRLLALCENCVMGYNFDALLKGFDILEHAQRSMPSFHAVLQILKMDFISRLKPEEETAPAIAYLDSIQRILEESGDKIAALFVEKFSEPVSVLTLSRSSTVLEGLHLLADGGLLRHLYVLESRPMNEGVKTIREFNTAGVEATIMVDAAMNEALNHVQCTVVGADSISADGFLLNKTGSYPLALCCRERGIPFYVLCDSLKFSPQLRPDMYIESRPESEITKRLVKDRFNVWNRYFEWVPIDLVSAFITEQGVFSPDQVSKLAGE
jgi:translation initiation factor 2B subunit (eIF-2B alpha/beta/delta family)